MTDPEADLDPPWKRWAVVPGSKRREIAIAFDAFAQVRLWLDRANTRVPLVVVEDLARGRSISLTPSDLLALIETRWDEENYEEY